MNALLQGFTGTLRRIFTDTWALLLMVVAVAGYSMFYPLPYLEEVVKESPIAVVDLDHTSLSRQLGRWADAHEALRSRKTVVVHGGDAGRFLVMKQVVGALAETTGTLSAGVEVRRLLASGEGKDQAVDAQGPVQLRLRPVFNTREGYASYVIPVIFVVILQQTLLLGVGLLLGTDCARGPAVGVVPRGLFRRFLGGCLAYMTLYAVHAAFYFGFCFWLVSPGPWRSCPSRCERSFTWCRRPRASRVLYGSIRWARA